MKECDGRWPCKNPRPFGRPKDIDQCDQQPGRMLLMLGTEDPCPPWLRPKIALTKVQSASTTKTVEIRRGNRNACSGLLGVADVSHPDTDDGNKARAEYVLVAG